MSMIYWVIGSNVATFILAWMISRTLARHQLLEEQAQREQELAKTQAWVSYLNTLQGGRHV
ncbi:MAG TPA: hypothetical protein PLR60_03080 [Syntrophorhabdaceae bacterium]|nr:hypothetical protein [Syntrophorhabdaceae bacterium]